MPTQDQKNSFDGLPLAEQERLEDECEAMHEELRRNPGTSAQLLAQVTVDEATVVSDPVRAWQE